MTIIKFSHRYKKFPRDYQRSKLLDVIIVKLEDLSSSFREYDTRFEAAGVTDFYPLPARGEYMLLLLQAGEGCGQLWTTIRSRWGGKGNDKYQYYKSKIGEVVECLVA
jgi:hypothetical protein